MSRPVRRLLPLVLEDRLAPAIYTWNGALDDNWSNPGNWVENTAPDPADPDVVVRINTADDLSVQDIPGLTLAQLAFGVSTNHRLSLQVPTSLRGNPGDWSIDNNGTNLLSGERLTLVGSTVRVLTSPVGSSLRFDNVIDGGQGLQVEGAGSLTLAAANRYTGGTTVVDGTVRYTNGQAFGTAAIALGIPALPAHTSATLFAASTADTSLLNPITVNADGAGIGSDIGVTTQAVYNGAITVSTGILALLGGSPAGTVFAGRLTGGGGIRVISAAPGRAVTLQNRTGTANDFAGNVSVNADSLLVLSGQGNDSQVPNTATVDIGSGGMLIVAGGGEVIGGLTSADKTAAVQAAGPDPTTLTIAPGPGRATRYDGQLTDGGGQLRLVKDGAGTVTLTNPSSTYSGGTLVRAGSLLYTVSDPFGPGAITLGDAGTPAGTSPQLMATGTADTTLSNDITAQIDGAVIGGTDTGTGPARNSFFGGTVVSNVAGGRLVLQAGTAPGTAAFINTTYLTGRLTGPGGIRVTATTPGRFVTLSNTFGLPNDFAGGIRIDGDAALDAFGDSRIGQLPATAVVTFASPFALLRMFAPNERIAGLSSTGPDFGTVTSPFAPVTLTLGGSSDAAYSGRIIGQGNGSALNLVKLGSGTQTLSGPVATSGTTTVSGGRLVVDGIVTSDHQPAAIVLDTGTLGGSGTILGRAEVRGTGVLAPGTATATGTLRVGGVTLAPTSTLRLKVFGTGAGQFDTLAVTGPIDLGGSTLDLPGLTAPLPPGIGLRVLDAGGPGGVTGRFGQVTAGDTSQFQVDYAGGDGNDVVVQPIPVVPPPGPRPKPVGFAVGGPGGTVQLVVPAGTTGLTVDGIAGTTRTATADFTGDGVADLVIGTGPGAASRVAVRDGATGQVVATVQPFEAGFTGGVYVATADLDGDGKAEIIVTPDQGGGPVVAVFRADGSEVVRFFGIDDGNFRGGARAAAGDMNGDGTPDLVVSAGFLGGPRIAVFDGRGVTVGATSPPKLMPDFFAFEDSLRNGAFVAAGDITGDGKADLVFGGGPGGAPRVRVFDGAKVQTAGPFQSLDQIADAAGRADFFAGDSSLRGGVRVAARDTTGGGTADLIVGSGDNEPGRVRVYKAATVLTGAPSAADQTLSPFGDAVLANGVFVG